MKKLSLLAAPWRAAAASLLRLLALVLLVLPAAAQTITEVNSDKARYNPGQAVSLSAAIGSWRAGLSVDVKYYHADSLMSQQTLSASSGSLNWSWTPPGQDYQGYLVALTLKNGSTTLDAATLGVDVSSDWKRYPRYGFLSEYGTKTAAQMDATIKQLNRYHLNGLQFYDWMDKHHRPLAGTPQAPAASWNDLANRPTSLATLKGYIDRGHDKNMLAMFYELIYGAYPTAAADGVDTDNWALYRDGSHNTRWSLDNFPSGWEASGLYIMNPGNAGWRSYFLNEADKVYNAAGLGFDGWHVDQLGDWGTMYERTGQSVAVDQTFGTFLNAAKNARSDKRLVMNAVNQYGKNVIGATPVDVTYTEMWTGNEEYASLGWAVQDNEAAAPGKRTVLAAYVNKGKSESAGYFNDASVLMADATIFAFGGAHIELGEHMLGNEYFPNSNLQMSSQLQQDITRYYDFAVAYENLLRGGRTFNNVTLSGGSNVRYWPPVQGKIATVGAALPGKQIFQLLNYTQAQTLAWRDDNQVQPVPSTLTSVSLSFPYSTPVTRLWTASPDFDNGLPQQLTFTQSNGTVTVTLPRLKYWSMLVAETSGASTPPTTSAPLKVYFNKPASWAGANIHYWNTTPTGTSTTWPGIAMTAAPEVGANWYSYTFPSGISSGNIVFNNNGDNATKTADLYRDHLGYYDYATSTWTDTAPAEFTVYCKKPVAWGTPYVHYWNTAPTGTSTTWPGIAMSAAPGVGADWYSYTFPSTISSANLVFSNKGDNDTKTADQYRSRSGFYTYATNSWTDSPPAASRSALATQAAEAPAEGLELSQNVPNPFDQTTTIRFAQPTAGAVRLEVYDLQGRRVLTLLDAPALPAGTHEATLPGATLAPGLYLYRLSTAAGTRTRRLLKLN